MNASKSLIRDLSDFQVETILAENGFPSIGATVHLFLFTRLSLNVLFFHLLLGFSEDSGVIFLSTKADLSSCFDIFGCTVSELPNGYFDNLEYIEPTTLIRVLRAILQDPANQFLLSEYIAK